MDQLGQMAFFTEKDRAAIVGHMKMKEAASRNIADLYRAVKAELETQGVGPADQRVRELERGIAAAEHDAAL